MPYSPELKQQLEAFFAQSKIPARFSDGPQGQGIFSVIFKLRCKLQNIQLNVILQGDNFSTVALLPLKADESHRLAVAEYIARVNYTIRVGSFDLNMADGEIRFKTFHHAGSAPLDANAANLSVMPALMMIERYGNGMLDVLFGVKTAREAFEAAMQQPQPGQAPTQPQ